MTSPAAARYDSRGVARIGVITPYSNTNLEADLALLRPPGVSFHVARAGGYGLDEIPNSDEMRKFARSGLDDVLNLILAARPDIVLYGCTSATLSSGLAYDREFRLVIAARARVPAVTAAGALIEGLKDLGARRIGFCSPYTEALNLEGAVFLEEAGFEVVRTADVGRDLGNYGQSDLAPEEVLALGMRADHGKAEAIVLSCTDMRAVEIIAELEARTGKPVVTSNQAMIHVALKRLGLESCVPGRLGRIGAGYPVSPGAFASIASA